MTHYDLATLEGLVETPDNLGELTEEQTDFVAQWKAKNAIHSNDLKEHIKLPQQVYWDATSLEYMRKKAANPRVGKKQIVSVISPPNRVTFWTKNGCKQTWQQCTSTESVLITEHYAFEENLHLTCDPPILSTDDKAVIRNFFNALMKTDGLLTK